MKRLFISLLLVSASAVSAQTAFMEPHQSYTMTIVPESFTQVMFVYTATATLLSTGEIVTLHGTVARSLAITGDTSVVLDFGGPISGSPTFLVSGLEITPSTSGALKPVRPIPVR